jgi:receptor protein-tyrosine kinase
MSTQTTTKARITDYIRPLTARLWLIVVAVVVATGGVYLYYHGKSPIYSASTSVYYLDPGDPVTGQASAGNTDRTVADQATLLDSRDTAELVAARIGYHGTPLELLRQVSISSQQGQDFINIAAQNGTAAGAAAIANGFADTLEASLLQGVLTRVSEAIRITKNELAQVPPGTGTITQRGLLDQQLYRLQLELKDPELIARVVDPAAAPSSPTSPKPVQSALFAFLLSLLGSVGLAYGLERFDHRLKNPEEMEHAYERALLAVVPHTSDPSPVRSGEAELNFDFREPFRVLRTNLELETLDNPPKTIVVTSAVPGEGKSTIVRNLSLAFRERGHSVVIVDLDLRRPTLGSLFGVGRHRGVTELLRGELDIDEALRSVKVGLLPFDAFLHSKAWKLSSVDGRGNAEIDREGSVEGGGVAASGQNGNGNGIVHPEVTLLLSGDLPANPAGVLASESLIEMLNHLRERFDIVLIDTAPVLAVTDTVPLLRSADGVLIVGRVGYTTRDTAKRLMEFLGRIPGMRLIGVVANDLARLEAEGYGYSYGYGEHFPNKRQSRRQRRTDAERARVTT